ncbi:hypothetical protein M9B40_01185 [SAR86 cluster bacterium]|jgi:hypothetical protein|uniref:Uncharacterized protein n=1 Tax=SAR86 cluster bacterium TaxID=2030880 RepID=A0A9Q8TZJ2_9GAMM|nr:hypothetical protein M9B40_01185 [SAR86 cluster bacterium]|tara:strand:+ start:19 stop:417 length:399 start_codon:yes stop_codon:yes gene_type:complete
MQATFFSGFSDTSEALDFMLEQIQSNFQIGNKVFLNLDNNLLDKFEDLKRKKFHETNNLAFLYNKNVQVNGEIGDKSFDEAHVLSSEINLSEDNFLSAFIYTTEADNNILKTSRELYSKLQKANIDVKHEKI